RARRPRDRLPALRAVARGGAAPGRTDCAGAQTPAAAAGSALPRAWRRGLRARRTGAGRALVRRRADLPVRPARADGGGAHRLRGRRARRAAAQRGVHPDHRARRPGAGPRHGALQRQRGERSELRCRAARAGRVGRAEPRVRLPDGDLLLLHGRSPSRLHPRPAHRRDRLRSRPADPAVRERAGRRRRHRHLSGPLFPRPPETSENETRGNAMTRETEKTREAEKTRESDKTIETEKTILTETENGPRALSPEQVRELGEELDALRNRVLADLGERDREYIYSIIRAQRGFEIAGRGLMYLGFLPPVWLAAVAALSVSKILDNMEIGHNVMHGQY